MSTPPAERDPKATAQRKFASAECLVSAGEIIERYATGLEEISATLVEAARPQRPDAAICELGFGSGWLLEELLAAYPEADLCGLDISPGMTAHGRELFGGRVPVVQGDIERLPFAGESFDVVLTCWTLYFMRDIDAALEEIKRTVRPGGRIVAATVAADHNRNLDELEAEAFRAAGFEPQAGGSARFNLTTGLPYMERHFGHVEVLDWRGEMTLPDVETTMRYWDLLWAPEIDADARDLVRPELARLIAERIARDGALRMKRHGAAFVASKDR